MDVTPPPSPPATPTFATGGPAAPPMRFATHGPGMSAAAAAAGAARRQRPPQGTPPPSTPQKARRAAMYLTPQPAAAPGGSGAYFGSMSTEYGSFRSPGLRSIRPREESEDDGVESLQRQMAAARAIYEPSVGRPVISPRASAGATLTSLERMDDEDDDGDDDRLMLEGTLVPGGQSSGDVGRSSTPVQRNSDRAYVAFSGESPARRMTPPDARSPESSSPPRASTGRPWGGGGYASVGGVSPAMTPSRPMRGHRRVNSSNSAASSGALRTNQHHLHPHTHASTAKATTTPQPNRNPFASPARGGTSTVHGRIVAHDLEVAAGGGAHHHQHHHHSNSHACGAPRFGTPETTTGPTSPQRSAGRSAVVQNASLFSSGGGSANVTVVTNAHTGLAEGTIVPRFGLRHLVPWEDEADLPDGGLHVPLHQDVNGTVWLGIGMLDGRPYAVKEVPFSTSVLHCTSATTEHQTAVAADPAIAAEMTALMLSRRTPYITRYFAVHHDPLLKIHVIQTEYCARGTLLEEMLSHYNAQEDDAGNDADGGSPAAAGYGRRGSSASPKARFHVPSEADVLRVLEQVYQGLAELHRNGISHNALCPRAVLVDDCVVSKIGQFGAATFITQFDAEGPSAIPPAIPTMYEPTGTEAWGDGETAMTRDVYTFAAGLMHIIGVAAWQSRNQQICERIDSVPLPAPASLAGLGFSDRVVQLFAMLVAPPAERPSAAQVVVHLAPPPPMVAALLSMCDVEAMRLRARIAAARAANSTISVSSPFARTMSPSGTGPRGSESDSRRPTIDMSSPPTALRAISLFGSGGGADGRVSPSPIVPRLGGPSVGDLAASGVDQLNQQQPPPTTTSRFMSRRPTQLMLSTSFTDLAGASCGPGREGALGVTSPLLGREASVMSPGPQFSIRMPRRSGYYRAQDMAGVLAAAAADRPTTSPGASALGGESPINYDPNLPFTAHSLTNASLVPAALSSGGAAQRYNSFDDAVYQEDSGGRPMTRSVSVQQHQQLLQPPTAVPFGVDDNASSGFAGSGSFGRGGTQQSGSMSSAPPPAMMRRRRSTGLGLQFPAVPMPDASATPKAVRVDTDVDLFGSDTPAAAGFDPNRATATPMMNASPQAITSETRERAVDEDDDGCDMETERTAARIFDAAAPALGASQPHHAKSCSVGRLAAAGSCPSPSSVPRDWTVGPHTECADEALRVLQRRMPHIVRLPAPLQDGTTRVLPVGHVVAGASYSSMRRMRENSLVQSAESYLYSGGAYAAGPLF